MLIRQWQLNKCYHCTTFIIYLFSKAGTLCMYCQNRHASLHAITRHALAHWRLAHACTAFAKRAMNVCRLLVRRSIQLESMQMSSSQRLLWWLTHWKTSQVWWVQCCTFAPPCTIAVTKVHIHVDMLYWCVCCLAHLHSQHPLPRSHCAVTCVPCITQLDAMLLSHMARAFLVRKK